MMPQQEMTDYFSRLLYPIIPLAVVGRSWAAEPVCERETAVYWNWKVALTSHEQIVLFCCASLTPSDTLTPLPFNSQLFI